MGTKCWKFVSTQVDYLDAIRACNTLGAKLASVTSAAELTSAQGMISSDGTWLGLSDILQVRERAANDFVQWNLCIKKKNLVKRRETMQKR